MWRLISSNRVKIGVGRFGYNVRYMSSGKDLLDGAKTSIQHGINLVKTGNLDLALMRFRKAIDVVDNEDGDGGDVERNVVRAAAYSNAATTLREKFRDSENFDHATESATNFKEAITSLEDAVGHEHIRISKVLCDFSLLLEMVEDHEGVEAALRRALTIHSNWGLNPNSKQSPGEAAAERTEMIVPLAAACKAQNNMSDVLELEDPFFKCVEVAIGTNPNYTETALDHVRTFMGILDKDQSEVDFALKLFQGLKSGSAELRK